MSKSTKQKLTFDYYQDKGYKFHNQLRAFDSLANSTHCMLTSLKKEHLVKEELEQWKEQVQKTGRKISSTAMAKKTCQLQDKHFKNFTPCEWISSVLSNDYMNQNFNGRGKKLLIAEIEKLEAVTKIFSFSKENRKNKILLKTMKSMLTKLEELETIQQGLRCLKAVSQVKGKEQASLTGKRKRESGSTEQESKQKASKTDMFAQREQLFREGSPKEQDETTRKMAEMDLLEESHRQSISVY